MSFSVQKFKGEKKKGRQTDLDYLSFLYLMTKDSIHCFSFGNKYSNITQDPPSQQIRSQLRIDLYKYYPKAEVSYCYQKRVDLKMETTL